MKYYEYIVKIQSFNTYNYGEQSFLQDMGNQGYELISVINIEPAHYALPNAIHYYFKKEIEKPIYVSKDEYDDDGL
jgi:hypothetical protein